MRFLFFAVAVAATTAVSPLRSQSLAGARAGLTSPPPIRSAAPRNAASAEFGGSSLAFIGDASGDKWARGMVTGAAVGLLVGFLINISQLQNGGTHSAILPAVGIGALLGLLIGSG
jgi:hypothetical protein